MTGVDLSRAEWQKSRCRSQSGNCEVAYNLPGLVVVRDSREPTGAWLVMPPETGGPL
jgi:Domain of unknown function (DUF397)